MLKSSLCDYSNAYIHIKRTITISNTGRVAASNNRNKKVIFKNCAPFTGCISEIKYTRVDNAKDIDIVMPMYNLIEYSGIYSKKSGNLWQYHRDKWALALNVQFNDFPAYNIIEFPSNLKKK